MALFLTINLILPGCRRDTNNAAQHQDVTIAGRTFHLELALTDAQRYQGLSDRHHIPANGGMLFAFETPQQLTFVMRRCYVPLDLIYLDPNGRVIRTYRMKVQPYDTPEEQLTPYASQWPAQFVIELAGGTLDRLDLHPGDRVDLPADRLKREAQ